MGDRSSGQRRGAGGVGGMGVGMGDIAGLFPSDSDEDEGQAYGSRSHVSTAKKAPESANKGDDAQGNWGLFPGKEGPLAQPPAPGAAGLAASLTPASEQVSGGTGKLKVKKGKKKKTKATAAVKDEGKAISSPLHTGVDDKVQDIEAACSTQPPPTSKSAEEEASDEFERNKDRSPAEWMRVGDTTGVFFLWYTVILQLASAACGVVFIASRGENQLTWRTGCWGKWTSLSDAENVEFVEFDTYVGWQFYGKEGNLGYLSEVSRSAAVVGGLAGGMHTLVVIIAGVFLFFSFSALWLSYYRHFCAPRAKSVEGEQDSQTKPKPESPLVLARDCHRWMFVMAGFDIIAGLWCFGIGCAGFYFVVLHDLTDGLEEIVSGWGDNVSCAKPLTTPRYGFYINAVSVFLLLGGGIISLQKAYASNRELNEAVEMWENDRAETAEMESRLAMIRKKEEYAAAAASAAASSTQSPAAIFKRKPGAAALDGAAANGGTSSRRASGTSEINSVLALSPPSPRSPASVKTISSAATTTAAGAAAGSTDRQHSLKVAASDVSSVDLRTGRNTNSFAPTAPMQSPEPDLESGSGGAAVAAGAADAGTGAPDNSGEGAVDDDLPPPQGWEVRTTPSGDKFWVNMSTKDVSWERPTIFANSAQ